MTEFSGVWAYNPSSPRHYLGLSYLCDRLQRLAMDMTKFSGGEPANFLEFGGNTTADKVAEALYVAESRYPTRDVNPDRVRGHSPRAISHGHLDVMHRWNSRRQCVLKYGTSSQRAINIVGPHYIAISDGVAVGIVRACLERDDVVFHVTLVRYGRNNLNHRVSWRCHRELHRDQRRPCLIPISTLVTYIVEEVRGVPNNEVLSVYTFPLMKSATWSSCAFPSDPGKSSQ